MHSARDAGPLAYGGVFAPSVAPAGVMFPYAVGSQGAPQLFAQPFPSMPHQSTSGDGGLSERLGELHLSDGAGTSRAPGAMSFMGYAAPMGQISAPLGTAMYFAGPRPLQAPAQFMHPMAGTRGMTPAGSAGFAAATMASPLAHPAMMAAAPAAAMPGLMHPGQQDHLIGGMGGMRNHGGNHINDHHGMSRAGGMGGMNSKMRGGPGMGLHGGAPHMGVAHVGMLPGGGRGRMGPGAQQQQQKRRPQRGMEDNIRRTVYVSYIDLQVTEEQLATFFAECGRVMDCRICGDPNSAMRFAFIEFAELESAQQALSKNGTVLGGFPLRVLPSKTAIVPVSKDLMPRSNEEVERCSRTVYIANIDKKVDRNDVRMFFEHLCGPVARLRLLGDNIHSTRICFIEFAAAEGALAALNCSGALLGSLPIRVAPSKTPVRMDTSSRANSNRAAAQQAAAAAAMEQQLLLAQQRQQEADEDEGLPVHGEDGIGIGSMPAGPLGPEPEAFDLEGADGLDGIEVTEVDGDASAAAVGAVGCWADDIPGSSSPAKPASSASLLPATAAADAAEGAGRQQAVVGAEVVVAGEEQQQ